MVHSIPAPRDKSSRLLSALLYIKEIIFPMRVSVDASRASRAPVLGESMTMMRFYHVLRIGNELDIKMAGPLACF